MNLQRLSRYELRLECLHAQPVQGWSSIQNDFPISHGLPEQLVLRLLALVVEPPQQSLVAGLPTPRFTQGHWFTFLFELAHQEGHVHLLGNFKGEAALVELQFGLNNNDRPCGVVHTLPEHVLSHASLLALQPFGHGLQGVPGTLRLRGIDATVVDKTIDCHLEHELAVAEKSCWSSLSECHLEQSPGRQDVLVHDVHVIRKFFNVLRRIAPQPEIRW
mmetsp:Transcript_88954/g.212324  ORF Transcript_88954/g.212324 Transcript_88954/m.212324 type:complete len:218 (+) Transcript_88954:477-1130(+)